jgi:hypothetical protein
MASELKIRWDGDVPGMAEHRLSLAQFGDALANLVAALRRIATQMVSTAEGEHPKTGRFAGVARQLDIEISAIEGNSTGVNGVVTFTPPPDMLPLFVDLPERATTELLDSIERESKGQAANWAVRKYLQSLPQGLHRQLYEFNENGTTKKLVEIGDVRLAEFPGELPSLREHEGVIVGVGFEPGRTEVRLRTDSSSPNLDATSEQVDMALTMRKGKVRVLGVNDGKRTRLLRLIDAAKPRFAMTDADVEEQIYRRWSGVLARLAR